jgi:ATP-grasp domain-containing protein/L-aminoacid ligase-like protein
LAVRSSVGSSQFAVRSWQFGGYQLAIGSMRVLLVSHTTGYQLRAFNEAAERLGIELVFATDRCHKLDDPWQDRAVAVRFHDVDASVDAIVARARQQPIDGVLAVGDRPLVLAARAAEALTLAWHSPAGARASADKRRSRAAIAAAGLPSPRHEVFPVAPAADGSPSPPGGFQLAATSAQLSFPCVLKPVGMSGSRGVIRANDRREFDAAFDRIRALLARPQVKAARAGLEDQILVEEYVEGREFAVEGVLTEGALQVFAIFDKPDPLEGPFFEETIYVTPSRLTAPEQARIVDHVRRASQALGLSHGPVHAECRVTPEGAIYVLEVAARPIGGLCSRVLTFDRVDDGPGDDRGGASLEEVLLLHAVGRSIAGVTRERAAAAVMMIPIRARGMFKGVSGEADARAIEGVTDIRITAKVGQLLETLPEAGSYLGFIFARGATPADAEHAVRAAHACLTFDVSRELVVRGR